MQRQYLEDDPDMKAKHSLWTIAVSLATMSLSAQTLHEISEPAQPKQIEEGWLKLGGSTPNGGTLAVNSFYITENGHPIIPVMGEFHFERYPREQWEEELIKIKAGGVNVLATYIFWNMHEPYEGDFRWTGNLDVRHFVELCQLHGLKVWIRIGPFCHGEIRNGGMPDWLFAKNLNIRSNDPNYLHYVEVLYNEIADQLKGLYYKDGGPIIGCQIENEHQHSAAPQAIQYLGEKYDMTTASYDAEITQLGVSVQERRNQSARLGDEHMLTLKRMAQRAGILTPFYSATGWGNAAVLGNEGLPVGAAYTYPTWVKEYKPTPFCLFKDIQRNPDYAPVRYDTSRFPALCAEMGVGIQMVYEYRPKVTAEAAEALMVRSLGSGSNGIGYYMYHGGSTPLRDDNLGFWSDEPMGVPKISYDFQAPLGEMGLEHGSYRSLRLLHSFLADFDHLLAPMETVLPEGCNKLTPENRDDLRWAVRLSRGEHRTSGFVFMVNFQDHDTLRHDMEGLQLQLNLHDERLRIPTEGSFSLPKDRCMILPFNLEMGSVLLKYATAQLLMKLDEAGTEHYVFFAPEGMIPEYHFDPSTVKGRSKVTVTPGLKSTFSVRSKVGKRIVVTTLTRQQALDAMRVGNRLLITSSTVLPLLDGSIELLSLGNPHFAYTVYEPKHGFCEYSVDVPEAFPVAEITPAGQRHCAVRMELPEVSQVQEYFLRMDFVGDVAHAYLGNRMVHDVFYTGDPWLIGLKRHRVLLKDESMNFYIRPFNGRCEVRDVSIIPEYRTNIIIQ